MATTTKYLGDFIEEIDERAGKDSRYSLNDIRGISSITKLFQETKANLVDVSPAGYKVVKPTQFAFNPNTARMGDKIPIALNMENHEVLVSSIYPVFAIKNPNELDPQYLWLWFKRPEFDRYARFKSHGSAREIFSWEEMCNVQLPMPDINTQRKIVNNYEVITRRIELLQKINDNLERIAFLDFRKTIANFYNDEDLPEGWQKKKLGDVCDVKGGKRLPANHELTNAPTKHPYIRVRDVGSSRYVCLTDQSQFIDEETYKSISRYIVDTDDIIMSIVGTIGLIGKIHHSLNKANLTENCVKLTNIRSITSDYLYYTLLYKKKIKEIELLTVGAVQPKLPLYNIQSIDIIIPPESYLKEFQKKMDIINQTVEANTVEIRELNNLASSFLARAAKGGALN